MTSPKTLIIAGVTLAGFGIIYGSYVIPQMSEPVSVLSSEEMDYECVCTLETLAQIVASIVCLIGGAILLQRGIEDTTRDHTKRCINTKYGDAVKDRNGGDEERHS